LAIDCFAFILSKRDAFRASSSDFWVALVDLAAGQTKIDIGFCGAISSALAGEVVESDLINVSFLCDGGERIA